MVNQIEKGDSGGESEEPVARGGSGSEFCQKQNFVSSQFEIEGCGVRNSVP